VEHEEIEFGQNSQVPPGNSSSGQPKANPKLKPPRRKCRARGQPQNIRVGAPKLARGANAHAYEGQCHELGLQREGDVPSVAVTGPISLQLNVESRDTALGHKSGTPLVQGVTTKSERIDIRNNENSVMDFQSKRQGISKFWIKRNLKKQKKTFLRRRIVFIKFLTG
jgi:hypothetical protein